MRSISIRSLPILLLALVPLVLALTWQSRELALPPHGEHSWRDADGLGVARCFVREKFNLLKPRVVERGEKSGIVGMEFPLVNAMGATLMTLFGVRDWLARLPCLLSLIPLFLGTWALGRRVLQDDSAAVISAGCLVMQPFIIIFSNKCMPEVPMLAALVWAMALAHDAIFRPSLARAFAAGALFAIAAILKPTGFSVAAPLVLWLLRALRSSNSRLKIYGVAAIVVAIPLIVAATWFAYARSLDQRYGLPLFKLHHDWLQWIELLTQAKFYTIILGRVLHTYLLWPTIIFMVIRFKDTIAVAKRHGDLMAWIFAGLLAIFLFGRHNYQHPYYALPFLAPIALFMGAFVSQASVSMSTASRSLPARWPLGHRFYSALCRPRIIQIVFMMVFMATALIRVEHRRVNPLEYDPARVALAMAHVPREGLAVVTDSSSPVVSLVRVDRLGWALPANTLTPDVIAGLRAKGAKFLVESSFGGWLAPESRAALPSPIWADDQLRAYVLAQ